jgi:transcription antitermination factor NusG
MRLTGNDSEAQKLAEARQWHALYTRHQHEKPVARMLLGKGHDVFLPLYTATRKWQDRTKQLSLPLFPCYLFIRGGLDRQLQILSTPGVFAVVGWAGRPAIIPDGQIEDVRQIVESSILVEPHPYMTCGDRVRIRSGTLQGLEGILVRKKNLFRLIISLEILGRSAAVEIDTSCLETVGPAPDTTQDIH